MTPTLQRPRFWSVTVAAALAVAATFSLGQWQLRRAAQKEALQAAVEAQGRLPILNTQDVAGQKVQSGLLHRSVTLKGVWQAKDTVYLDNRPMDGKSGFNVVTPLVLEGGNTAILVQRGWVQRNFTDRTKLPEITTPAGPVTVRGRIAPPPSKLYEFQGSDTGSIRQNLDIFRFQQELGIPLLQQVSLLQIAPANEGLLRDWPAPNLGVDRHYGYAFQWFGLCALLVVLYGWFQILPLLRRRRPDTQ